MESIYFVTTFTGAIVCMLTSILLFSRRKDGERSRTILAIIVLFSVLNYATRFIELYNGEEPERVISVKMLLTAIFMVTSYIMYPIEVISPGYLNLRRILKIYIPWFILISITVIAMLSGVEFTNYSTLIEMFSNYNRFEASFRIGLAFLFFLPVITIFTIPYTRKYNNTDKSWMRKYLIIFTLNTFAYLIVLSSNSLYVKTLYYYISVGCSLTIAYMEIFERLIRQSAEPELNIASTPEPIIIDIEKEFIETTDLYEAEDSNYCITDNTAVTSLSVMLSNYMQKTHAWENPDLSASDLYIILNTNRTTFGKVIKKLGYDNLAIYLNTLRIEDFISRIKLSPSSSYRDVFYDVGFRSRSSAFRNFRQITGTTPTEYFKKEIKF